MIRVDANYLYVVGSQVHPLSEFRAYDSPGFKATSYEDARFPLLIAESALEGLLTRSIFNLHLCGQAGNVLLSSVKTLKAKIEGMERDELSSVLDFMDAYSITSSLTAFEAVLGAELSQLPLFVATRKAGFDTSVLIDGGFFCFPAEIYKKSPEAIPDLAAGTKCIAFDLPTAAGFHLHRANEAILRRYWDAVTNGQARPKSRNMGDYLAEMDKINVGNPNVKAALRHLKDFHRNPLVHPEHSLDSVDDAIALMNGIHTVIVYMLKEMPELENHENFADIISRVLSKPT